MLMLLQNSNISLYICIFCFKTARFHYTYANFASTQQYFIVHMHILLQNSNISLYICKFCFKTAIFHCTYVYFASKQKYFIIHMQILRHSSLFPPARIDSSILPARQERSQHSSRPPGSIPAFFPPARIDPSAFE